MMCDRNLVADSSSKTRNARSLATALRDRGSYLIPVQPNRSLPIRPAPLPTRSFRKNGPSLLVLSKPANLDLVDSDPIKSSSLNEIPNETTIRKRNGTDASSETTKTSVQGSSVSKDYNQGLARFRTRSNRFEQSQLPYRF